MNPQPIEIDEPLTQVKDITAPQPSVLSHLAPLGHVARPTFYVPVVSPPTPTPSPRPEANTFPHHDFASNTSPLSSSPQSPSSYDTLSLADFRSLSTPAARRSYLERLIGFCTPTELLHLSTLLTPLLKRDFLTDLPKELALHILSFVDDYRSLARVSQVSRAWRELICEESIWRRLVNTYGYTDVEEAVRQAEVGGRKGVIPWRRLFQYAQTCDINWRKRGRLLRTHRAPEPTPDEGAVVTSLAVSNQWVVVGLASSRVQVFAARSGVLWRTLVGHASGVWAVCLVNAGGRWRGGPEDDAEPPARWAAEMGRLERTTPVEERGSDAAGTSDGWGQPGALIVSGGCDKEIRVWDVPTGRCVHVLTGHGSTIRCIRVLNSRPIAVSGSRDGTLRVWDIRAGRSLRVLSGHEDSVRALDVFGNKVVSGSYDRTCRLWDVDTGACLRTFRGHYYQIYTVAFDGVRIASAGLDTTVRVWDAEQGNCIALLQGHTALVCQLQINGPLSLLATGGSDGRVITFSLKDFTIRHRVPAHDSSVVALQFDDRFVVTGGADGRVRVFETATGAFVREIGTPCENVWKAAWCGDVLALACRRAGRTVTEIWAFRPDDEDSIEGLLQTTAE